ncbi:MAG: excinuclease ABC subunit UvrA, partial [Myxococcota bacterium]
GKPVTGQTTTQMLDRFLTLPDKTRFTLLAPIVTQRKGTHQKELESLRREGFARVRVNGEMRLLDEDIVLDKKKKHSLDVVIDRLSIRENVRTRLADSMELALSKGQGYVKALFVEGEEWLLSQHSTCPFCGQSFPERTPQMFSFNSPQGACTHCSGLGFESYVAEELVVPNPSLSIAQGAIVVYGKSKKSRMGQQIEELCRAYGEDPEQAFEQLPVYLQDLLLHGTRAAQKKYPATQRLEAPRAYRWFEGILPMMHRHFQETESDLRKDQIEPYMRLRPCAACNGQRLNPASLKIMVGGMNIADVTRLPIHQAQEFFAQLQLSAQDEEIARRILKEIRERLRFLVDVGLDYLSLDRA